MADGVILPGDGADVATDEIAGKHYQRVKLIFGVDGQSNGDVSFGNPFPVVDIETLISRGLVPGSSVINKVGKNAAISTGTTPEDVWGVGGVYTGFPTGAAQTLEAVSTSMSDTGLLTVRYLADFTSTDWQEVTVRLDGTTPVSLGVSAVRAHRATYNTEQATTFNVGNIAVRHAATPANIFLFVEAGRSRSEDAVYTIPAGKTGYMRRFFVSLYSQNQTNANGGLWVREYGKSPVIIRPFGISTSDRYEESIYGGLVLPEKTDVTLRMEAVGSNNVSVIGGFDIVSIDNAVL